VLSSVITNLDLPVSNFLGGRRIKKSTVPSSFVDILGELNSTSATAPVVSPVILTLSVGLDGFNKVPSTVVTLSIPSTVDAPL